MSVEAVNLYRVRHHPVRVGPKLRKQGRHYVKEGLVYTLATSIDGAKESVTEHLKFVACNPKADVKIMDVIKVAEASKGTLIAGKFG